MPRRQEDVALELLHMIGDAWWSGYVAGLKIPPKEREAELRRIRRYSKKEKE